MATKRKSTKNEALVAFEAVSLEGGLLSPELLSHVSRLEAGAQSEADYRVPKGLQIRDEIGRYWRIALALWAELEAARNTSADRQAVAERFVCGLLRDCLGFGSLAEVMTQTVGEHTYPLRFAALGGRVPVVIAPLPSARKPTEIETSFAEFGEAGRKRSAFGLAQEYLNAFSDSVWGIVSDGVRLRILRDNSSLTRPAWVEVDLARIFAEELYADFALLWLLCHETRFGRADLPAQDCALEKWREEGQAQGSRARDQLRRGVEEALLALGEGFVAHPENAALREALHSGALSTTDYFAQLLRLVYRLIFLVTAEERGLLFGDDSDAAAVARYNAGYSMRRLRERAVRRSAHDRHHDLFEALKITFAGLAHGHPRLALKPLGGLFATTQCPALDGAKLANNALLGAVFRLAWMREKSGLVRVNWRDMGPEELGSVYESLLELVPRVDLVKHTFSFAGADESKGNARKTSGSYYTPDSLVQVLLDSALEPVIAETIAANPKRGAEALLELSIVDPACGSGHFLLGAARRLAGHVARLRAAGTPSAREYRKALRQVVSRCVFGVDLNPMAIELCKVALWMEAMDPGLPLGFLDAHIQCGNSLLGATRDLMAQGIRDEAWEAIEGDDKKVASALKKRNKSERAGQGELALGFVKNKRNDAVEVEKRVRALDEVDEDKLEDVARKEHAFGELLRSDAFRHEKFVADMWCAAFVWPKVAGENAASAPTHGTFVRMRDEYGLISNTLRETVEQLARQYRFFHWELAFAQVFAKGGFDVVLGNPPWERVKLQEQEFFASRHEEIATASNASIRKKLIAALPEADPGLWRAWCDASRVAEGESHFVRKSTRYPLCGKGDVNTYALFSEHNRSVLGGRGRAGFIVPTGIATDDSTKEYFSALVNGRQLASFYSFENEEFVFPSVHHAFKFALLAVDRSGRTERADLVFFARQTAGLADSRRHFQLSTVDFHTLNPNTRGCPTFRSQRDATLNLVMYRRTGVFWDEHAVSGNSWGVSFLRMLDMTNDAAMFLTASQLESVGAQSSGSTFLAGTQRYVPLLEAKMMHHFDHRFASYDRQVVDQAGHSKLPELDDEAHVDPYRVAVPDCWVAERHVDDRLDARWGRGWLMGWRDITNASNLRTVIATIFPRAGVGNTTPLILTAVGARSVSALYANLCAIPIDYAARQKVGGTHLNYLQIKQLPVLPPSTYDAESPWERGTVLRDWILPRVLELTYTAWDLEAFARDVGYDGPPFVWNTERRALLRAELDACFFHLYGLDRDDTDYILETFPIVKKNDEKAFGEYRTKRLILECYDAMAESMKTGRAYVTRLVPGPADAAVAHRPR